MTTSAASATAHATLIRAAADLIEQAGIASLTLFPWPDEIVIQVPEASGDEAARLRSVARLAVLAGASAPAGAAASGRLAGHPVRIYTPVTQESGREQAR